MVKPSIAGRIEVIKNFLNPSYTDEIGVFHDIKPLITEDEARRLLDMPSQPPLLEKLSAILAKRTPGKWPLAGDSAVNANHEEDVDAVIALVNCSDALIQVAKLADLFVSCNHKDGNVLFNELEEAVEALKRAEENL